MKRTTIYLDPDLEIRLKLEAQRRKKPMAEIIRELLRKELGKQPRPRSRYAGAFDSGHTDTAERAEELLAEGLGLDSLSPEQVEALGTSR
ncbi:MULTISPECIES: CopG family transcriptional regulator [unclassified Meiothermus]|uniref:ribbon-helix-helix domain-containing protein n=1 Tax=unclassified Meiothermus TaxID=370471 RepID=UPI000D7C60F0|nr:MULTISPECIES: CopG family transcriptional regulator [unclassified Meiothermus]PZA08193.1 DNA-binding protein [Meiothermus sp. Pnk-1]RYM36772.1 ribbon-helix-helix protein, CopG family [Meiothermus sp. PNK-Is4]